MFEDKRNRSLLAVIFTALAAVECIFFAYTSEGMYTPLYPALLDLLCALLLPALCHFIDYKRKTGIIFILLAALLQALFSAFAREWFLLDHTEGFFAFQNPTFPATLARFLLLCIVPPLASGFWKSKDWQQGERFIPAVLAAVFFVVSLCFGGRLLYALLLAASAYLAGFLCERLSGGGVKVKPLFTALLIAAFLGSCALYVCYDGGRLLIEEAACAIDLMIILTGLVLALTKRRFGIYLYTYTGVHLILGYLGAWAAGDTGPEFLFGILPMALTSAAGFAADRWGCEEAELPVRKPKKKK